MFVIVCLSLYLITSKRLNRLSPKFSNGNSHDVKVYEPSEKDFYLKYICAVYTKLHII